MKTSEENTVITLKAEFVNEMEFVPAKEKVSRHSDETRITHPYKSDYEATVAVKVGNAVKNLTFKDNYYYVSSFTRDDGTHVSGESFQFLGLDQKKKPFEELENAGIKVDYFDVLIQYQEMVKEAKHREILIKRYKNWESIRKAKQSLKNSWIQNFEGIIKADKNKKIQEIVKNCTFTPSTKYNENHYIDVVYKGVVVPFHKVDGSFCFNQGNYGWESYLNVYSTDGEKIHIAEDKLRRAKREGTIFLKAMEEVEIYFKQKEYRINKRKKELAQINETKKHLEEVLGMPVIVTEERKYSRERNSNYSWLEKKYFLLLEQPTSKYSSPEIIRIFKNEDKFGVAGLDKLRRDQFKQILNIILDGRKPLKKLVVPEEKE